MEFYVLKQHHGYKKRHSLGLWIDFHHQRFFIYCTVRAQYTNVFALMLYKDLAVPTVVISVMTQSMGHSEQREGTTEKKEERFPLFLNSWLHFVGKTGTFCNKL